MRKYYILLLCFVSLLLSISETNAQGTETFEAPLPVNSTSFTRAGLTFTSSSANFDTDEFAGAGAGGSDRYIDNIDAPATNSTYSISITGGATLFTMQSMEVYVSSIATGDNPTADGTMTFRGFDGATQVFTSTKTTGFPTTFGSTNGFFLLDFTALPVFGDASSINIDRLEVSINGAFQYFAIDNFEFDNEVLEADPPEVQSITVVGTPASTAPSVDFLVTFNENANNVSTDDFALDAVGTFGTIASVSASSGTAITVTVNGISGEGTISIDLNAGTNIADDLGNTPPPAFTAGQNHVVSRCFQETFESYTPGDFMFATNGVTYTTGTANFDVENFGGGGAGGSDQFLSNLSDQGTAKVYSITTPGPELFTIEAIDFYLSSQANGANPTNDGTLTLEGRLTGSTLYTIQKTTGFPTNFSVNNGFYTVDFATEGASDYSLTNIDELRITIGGAFIYIALDNFEHCEEVTAAAPPIVQSIKLIGNPPANSASVNFEVIFNENANLVSTDDFSLNLQGSAVGTIASLTGSGNTYNVLVNAISGEGSLRLDLNPGTNIEDDSGNTPPDPFTDGERFIVSICDVETYEGLADGTFSWTTNTVPWASQGATFSVDEFIGAGAGGSDRYIDNLTGQGTGDINTIAITDTQMVKMGSMEVYVSSILNGDNPTNDGTLTVRGKLDGTTLYTVTKSTGFPTTFGTTQGFYLWDFATEGGTDWSMTDVDEIEMELGGAFQYLAVDNFKFCMDPPDETEVALVGGALTITDINGGTSDDTITLSVVGPNLRITNTVSRFQISGAGVVEVDDNTVDVLLANITNGITVDAISGNDAISITSVLNLPGATNSLTIQNFDSFNQSPGSDITMGGDITYNIGGTVDFRNTNAGGNLMVTTSGNIGNFAGTVLNIAGITTLNSGAANIQLGGNHNFVGLINATGNIVTVSGTPPGVWNLNNINATSTIGVTNNSHGLTFNGVISGPGLVQLRGGGTEGLLQVGGTISADLLEMAAGGQNIDVSLPGNDANLLRSYDTNNVTFVDIDDIDFADVNVNNVTITAPTINFGGGSTVTLNSGASSFNGDVLSSAGSVLNHNGGSVDFTGTSINLSSLQYNGVAGTTTNMNGGLITAGSGLTFEDLNVNSGDYQTNNVITTVNGIALISGTANLIGTGSISGEVVIGAGGELAAGNSPGCLATGSLTLLSGSTSTFEVTGLTPCTQHDQIQVTGTITIDPAADIAFLVGYANAPADEIILFLNDGVDPISGTFNGYPEGTAVVFGAFNGFITYVGGDGNDVSLVADTVPPTAVCMDITVQLDAAGNASIVGTDVDGGSTDNVGITSYSVTPNTFNCSDVGTPVSVTLTVMDAAGNSDSCTAIVTVEDNVAPNAICNDALVELDETGNATINGALIGSSSTDACGIATLDVTPNTFTCDDIGANMVTLTVTDVNGNSSSCMATVMVVDNVTPTITNVTTVDPTDCTPNDNGSITIEIFQPLTDFILGPGTYTINTDTGDFNGGGTSPGFNGTQFSFNNIDIQAGAVLDVIGNQPLLLRAIGTTNIAGTINVFGMPGTPGGGDRPAGPGGVGRAGGYNGGAGGGLAPGTNGEDGANGMGPGAGGGGINGNATGDSAGGGGGGHLNNGQNGFATGGPSIAGTGGPAYNTPLTGGSGGGGGAFEDDPPYQVGVPGPEDDAGGAGGAGGGVVRIVGNDITISGLIDAHGGNGGNANAGTGSAGGGGGAGGRIEIEGGVNPPVISGILNVSGGIRGVGEINSANGGNGSPGITTLYARGSNISTPNVEYSIDGGTNYQASNVFTGLPAGTYMTAVRIVGTTCSNAGPTVTLTLNDTTPPNAVCQNITVELDATGNATITANDIDNGSSDSCGIASLSVSPSTFSCSDVGANTVTLTVTDVNGNSSSCTATVTVEDNIPPTITCPADITVNNDPGICGAVVNYTDPTFSDNCPGTSSVTFSYTGSFQTFIVPNGVTSINIEAWGASGQDVTVEQYTPSTGGLGGYASGDLAVTPGETIYIYVGGAGTDGAGGYNGGSTGGFGTAGSGGISGFAGSGGGASDVRQGGSLLGDRVIVGGGGGGGGRDYVNGTCQPCGQGGNGGAGGGATGVDGQDPTDPIYGTYFNPGAGGKGGSQVSGGLGGNGPQGPDGNPGVIGDGGLGIDGLFTIASGGGGGGYYGGGSGAGANNGSGVAGAGGAGGSSYIGGVINGSTNNGVRSGDGEIILSWASSGSVTQTAGLPSGSVFPVGTTINTFEITDASGNTATCSFEVIVNDNEPPVVTCPTDITVSNDTGDCGAIVSFTPTVTDNCPGTTVSSVPASGSFFPVGTTLVTLTGTDASGNTVTCTFNVIVNDTEDPTITCPADILANNDPGVCGAVVTFTDPVGTDNCPGATTVQIGGLASGSTFPVGTTTNTFEVTDASGNTATCSFNVTVVDVEDPTITCPGDITVNNDPGVCGAVVNYTVTESDNCTRALNQIPNQTGTFNGSARGYWFTAPVDFVITGLRVPNTASNGDQNVQVMRFDVVPPNFSATGPYAELLHWSGQVPGNGFIPVNISISAGDIIGILGTRGTNNVNSYTNGTNMVIAGINVTIDRLLTQNGIHNAAAPQGSFSTEVGSPNQSRVEFEYITPITTQTAGLPSGSVFPVGTTTNTFVTTDGAGNTATCSFTVTVNDAEPPVITCPADITQNNDPGVCEANVIVPAPTFTDNCATAGCYRTEDIETYALGPILGQDPNWETWTPGTPSESGEVSNEQAQSGTQSVKITGVPAGGPVDQTYRLGELAAGAWEVTYSMYVPAGNTAYTNIQKSEVSGIEWANEIQYNSDGSAQYNANNTFTTFAYPQNVWFEVKHYIDLTNDINEFFINGTSIISHPYVAGANGTGTLGTIGSIDFFPVTNGFGANSTEPNPSAIPLYYVDDISLCAVPINDYNNTADASDIYPVGTTTVNWTVTDPAGNSDTCSHTVTVIDNEPPVANCTAPFTVQLDATGNATITVGDIDNGSTDNCGIASMSIDPSTFTCADVGPNTVTLTVTDVNGNTSTCTTIVTVEDNVPPVAVCQNITIDLDTNGNATITPADVDGGSSDACGIASLSIDIDTFDCSNVGPNNVVLTVTDVNGNSSQCTAIVTVQDVTAPFIACPADIVTVAEPDICGIVLTYADPFASDACGIASVVLTGGLPSGSIFPVGVTIVEWTATDVNGNTATCSFTVTVTDTTPPVAVCQNITIPLDASGNATITVADVDGGTFDNCALDTLSIDIDTFDCSNVGSNNVTLTATDIYGNTSTCVAIVTVEDVTAPVAVCQNITVQLDATGTVTINPADLDGGSTDACGIDTAAYSVDIDTFDCSNIGDNTVVLTVTDVNGNTATCTAIVTVEDDTDPDLVCQDITVELDENGLASIVAEDLIASNTDACGIALTSVDISDFDCDDIGTPVLVTVFSEDINGNIASCTATVTVVDLLAPVVTCPADIEVDPGGSTDLYEVPDYLATGEATAVDNCTDPLVITTQVPAPGTLLGEGTYTVTITAEDESGNIGTCSFELTVDSTLGTNDITFDVSTIVMYPNPAKAVVNISNPQAIPLENATIYDVTGRLVKTFDLRNMGTEKTLDIATLASATYVVIIQSESGTITKQLIKE